MPSWLFIPVFTKDLHQQISPPGFLLIVTTCLCLRLQSLNHAFPRNCNTFGKGRNCPVVSLLPASPCLILPSFTRWGEGPSSPLATQHLLAEIPGGNAAGGKGPQSSTADPLLERLFQSGAQLTHLVAMLHTLFANKKNWIYAWQTSSGEGLPNYQGSGATRLGDAEGQWGALHGQGGGCATLCHGTHG